ncbi:MAG TPA: SulP family inorganic anion transporter [Solirubrobacteraceae bacterium]|nr:SulP family inorganic anion transporter [Solirubrobacteraceae bacterium]
MSWLFPSLRGYRRDWLRGDVLAGLTVWAVLVPEALAYATIAGVSPVVGLYAAPAALIFYAAFGSSKHLVTGPMAATAALSAATVGDYATAGSGHFVAMTAALGITVGIAALAAGALRLGFLANFISEPVLKGFIVGLALTIIVGQLPKLFGVQGGSGDFFEKLWDLLGELGDTSALTLLIGVVSLALVLLLKRLAPVLPGSLIVVFLGVAAVEVFALNDHGVEIVGHIDGGLPSLGFPNVSFSDLGQLSAGAIGIMLVGFAEGLGAAKIYATRDRYEIDTNRELIGVGAANLGAGLSSGMVVNGSLSKTAVNGSSGARTQLSGLLVAALTILTLLFLTGLFESLPEATLAAVVIAALIELVDIPSLVALYRVYTKRLGEAYGVAARPDFIAAIAAMLGVTVFDTLPGLFIGIGISFLLLLYRASRPRVVELGKPPGDERFEDLERHPESVRVPGVIVLRVESGLFFANAEPVRTEVRRAAREQGTRTVVLDAETIPFIDVSAARMLDGLADELRQDGVSLVLARDVGQVRDVLRTAGGDMSRQRVYPTVRAAVEASLSKR